MRYKDVYYTYVIYCIEKHPGMGVDVGRWLKPAVFGYAGRGYGM